MPLTVPRRIRFPRYRKSDSKETLTAGALIETLEGLGQMGGGILHLSGWHRVPRLLCMMGLSVSAGIDLPGHRLPGVGTFPSAELVALVYRSLTALLKRNEWSRSKDRESLTYLA